MSAVAQEHRYAWQDREQERQKRLKQQMKEQDQRRFQDPDEMVDLDKIWVIYSWEEHESVPGGKWILAGFRRRRRRRKPQTMNRFFAKVRRKLEIHKATPVMILDLQTAALWSRREDKSWQYDAPKRQTVLKPSAPIVQVIPKAPKTKVLRIRKDRSIMFHKKHTSFIALARRSWERDPEWCYLGPLAADTLPEAYEEGKEAAAAYDTLEVVAVDDLSKRLKNAMHRARKVRPGLRIRWPEPMALEAILALPASQLRTVPKADALYHIDEQEKVARRSAKSKKDRSKQVTHALAVLSFLYDLPSV